MQINRFNPGAAGGVPQPDLSKVSADQGATAAARTGLVAEKAKANQTESLDEETLARIRDQEVLNEARDVAMESMADEAAQANRTRKKDETNEKDEADVRVGSGQVGHGEMVHAPEEDIYDLTHEEDLAIGALDSRDHAVDLNADMPEHTRVAAENMVNTKLSTDGPEKVADLKTDRKVDEAAATPLLKLAEAPEKAARPMDILDPADVSYKPLQVADEHAE
ncbi:MAG: hypothetical protein KC910_24845, partial [Candidatus Eremiobacteraeota bacterium]|nr:hypothetical protein [Candidatus Eremiobacteraeota bacterium]